MPGEALSHEQSRSDIQLIEIQRVLLRFEVNPLVLRFWMPLKGVKEGVKSPMSTLSDKLDTVCVKLNVLEGRQKTLEDDLCASSSSPRTPVPGKRIRRTPPAMQVASTKCLTLHVCYVFIPQNKIRLVHSSLNDDQQFNLNEP